ncbi:hypothetical protein [Pseudoxanthomonas mexicana]
MVALALLTASASWLRGARTSAEIDRRLLAEHQFNEAASAIETAVWSTRIPRVDLQCSKGEMKVLIVSSGCASKTAALIQAGREGKVYFDGSGDGGHFIGGKFRDRYQTDLDAATVDRLRAEAAKLAVLTSDSEFNCGSPCFAGGAMVCIDGKRRAAYSAGFERRINVGSDAFYRVLSAEPGRDPAAPEGICI